ncbi:MAG: alpha/beta hydrolase [Synergistales bacterium]|nr:alpha/beta hydrolase [Synergistales bacterium]
MLRVFVIIIIIYVSLSGIVFLFQDRLIFQPWKEMSLYPSDIGLSFEEVELECSDGTRISGWFLPHDKEKGVFLFFHGNAGNMSHRMDTLELFHDLGMSVLIIDYRGYGNSRGKPSEQGLYQDGIAAWEHLVRTRGVDPSRIILFGRSLGGAVAAHVASISTAGGLILESTFTSAGDLGREVFPFLPVRQLLRHKFDILSRIRSVTFPVMVIHSREDDIIPFKLGKRLYDLINSPDKMILVIRGDHNTGFWESREIYIEGLNHFLEKVLGGYSDGK